MHPSPCAEGRTCCCCPSPRRYRSDPDLPGRFAGRGCPRGKSRNCPKFPEFPGEEVRPRASRRFRRNRRGFSPPTRPLAPSDEKRLRCERRSEEHTSELQSRENLVCRLLLEKKKENVEKID